MLLYNYALLIRLRHAVRQRLPEVPYVIAHSHSVNKALIHQDGKVRLFEALPACNLKIWPPYWKRDNER